MDDIGRGKITLVIEIQTLEKDKASTLANTQAVLTIISNQQWFCEGSADAHTYIRGFCS